MSIEKIFGTLKRRFPALKFGLRLKKPEDNLLLITCCFILHNICTASNDDTDVTENNSIESEENVPNVAIQAADSAGLLVRRSMIELFENI